MKFVALALISVALAGCAHKPCHNCAYGDKLVAHYDRSDCIDMPQGRYKCKNVVFDPQALNIPK